MMPDFLGLWCSMSPAPREDEVEDIQKVGTLTFNFPTWAAVLTWECLDGYLDVVWSWRGLFYRILGCDHPSYILCWLLIGHMYLLSRKFLYYLSVVHPISQSTMGRTCTRQNYGSSWSTWQVVLYPTW